MTINIDLSMEGIRSAINRLNEVKENLEIGINDLVEVLAHDGAEIANEAYAEMAEAAYVPVSMTEAQIVVPGGDKAIIAEFGAGYATMEHHPFAKNAPVPIKVGSYSEAHDGMFARTDRIEPGEGYWIFGWTYDGGFDVGRPIFYDRIQPRHGLLNAYDYIMQNSTRIAREVIKL